MFPLLRPKTPVMDPQIEAALDGKFSEAEISAMSRLGSVVELADGAEFATEGTVGCEAVVILDGTAEVSRQGETIASVGVGTVLGEMALLNDEPRNATLVANSPMTVVTLSRSQFEAVMERCPRLDMVVRGIAKERAAEQ